LNEVESQIENEQQFNEQKELIEKILNRLINFDNVIIKLDNKSGLKTMKETEGGDTAHDQDPILVVHPNYMVNE